MGSLCDDECSIASSWFGVAEQSPDAYVDDHREDDSDGSSWCQLALAVDGESCDVGDGGHIHFRNAQAIPEDAPRTVEATSWAKLAAAKSPATKIDVKRPGVPMPPLAPRQAPPKKKSVGDIDEDDSFDDCDRRNRCGSRSYRRRK